VSPLKIGPNSPVVVVGEIGQNHNGNLDTALRMIEAAKESGADAIKFQKRTVAAIPPAVANTPKQTPEWFGGMMTYAEYREKLEFSLQQYTVIDEFCRTLKIPWFVSVWDVKSYQDMTVQFPEMPAWKIPSAMLTKHELLIAMHDAIAPIIISTGMSTMEEVSAARRTLMVHNRDIIIAHCNSTYPCPPEDLNLRCIDTLLRWFPDTTIGYSGHEVGLATTVAAVAMGARYVERHITLNRASWGTDQAASVEPSGFRRLVKDIRMVESALGDGEKRITAGELEPMERLRGSPRPGISHA
jgi:N-acetylneuraminate synthase